MARGGVRFQLRALALVALLGASGAVSASSDWADSHDGEPFDRITATDATVAGPLHTFHFTSRHSGGPEGISVRGSAKLIEVQQDGATAATSIQGVGSPTPPDQWSTTSILHENANITIASNAGLVHVYGIPVAGASWPHVASQDARLRLGIADVPESDTFAGRDRTSPPGNQAIQVSSLQTTWIVTGSLRLRLHETTTAISDAEGQSYYWSGQRDKPYVHGAPLQSTDHVETWLLLHNATLVFTGTAEHGQWFLEEAQLAVDGMVAGHATPQGLEPETIWSAEHQSTRGGRYDVQRAGQQLSIRPMAEETQAAASPLGGEAPIATLTGSLSAAGIALAAVLLVLVLTRASRQRRLRAMTAALRMGDHRAVLGEALRLRRPGPHEIDAWTMEATAALRDGQLEHAETVLARGGTWPGVARATQEFLMASILARRGDAAGARVYLDRALTLGPHFLGGAESDPWLHRLVGPPQEPPSPSARDPAGDISVA